MPESLQASARNFIKEKTLAHVFSSEFSEISNSTFFTEHLRRLLLLIKAVDSFKISLYDLIFNLRIKETA